MESVKRVRKQESKKRFKAHRENLSNNLTPKRLDFDVNSSSEENDEAQPLFKRSKVEAKIKLRMFESPPSSQIKGMKLIEWSNKKDKPTVPVSPLARSNVKPLQPRVLFEKPKQENHDRRRYSAPVCQTPVRAKNTRNINVRRCLSTEEGPNKRQIISNSAPAIANINPFTPTSLNISTSMKRMRQQSRRANVNQNDSMSTPKCNGPAPIIGQPETPRLSVTPIPFCLDKYRTDSSGSSSNNNSIIINVEEDTLNPSKRLKVRDINISRYQEEFLELYEIASGSFGKVKVARHRLDGMVYAIKVTTSEICSGQEERVVMNEIFAHAALMKHKHVVRYYNSWVENNKVYIQNEYCEGGSLAKQIVERKKEGKHFSENELKRIVSHLAKGLQYIHSKQLVHLDIKPENIFLALDHLPSVPSDKEEEEFEPLPEPMETEAKEPEPEKLPIAKPLFSTDSGNGSSDNHKSGPSPNSTTSDMGSPSLDRVSYKIGDLGHVAQIQGDYIPEEGDCRYMAPELLLHDVDREKLPKADIFSLGMTLYECATLEKLPKNSMEDPLYEKIRVGNIPPVAKYSKEFNQLIKLMTSPDMMCRPSASRILSHPLLKITKSRSNTDLANELKKTKDRIRELEELLMKNGIPTNVSENKVEDKPQSMVKILVGKGAKRSMSSMI